MNKASTSISCKGDRHYVQQLKALAAMHQVSLATLVRHALDAMYSNELRRFEQLNEESSSFFTQDVAYKLNLQLEDYSNHTSYGENSAPEAEAQS